MQDDIKEINKVVHIDDAKIRNHLDVLVKDSVEETLNALLDAEADRMCGAQRYERSADRVDMVVQDTTSGNYTPKPVK